MRRSARFFTTMIGVLSLSAASLPFDQHSSLGITAGADPEMTPRSAVMTAPDTMYADCVSTPGQDVSTFPVDRPLIQVRPDATAAAVTEDQASWYHPSDVRMKKDIEDIGYGLSFIKQLRPVKYKLKDGSDRYDFGFIAQEVEFLLGDDYSILGIGGGPDRMLSLRYTDFIAPLVRAAQEQQAQLDAQRVMIEELRSEIAALKQKTQ